LFAEAFGFGFGLGEASVDEWVDFEDAGVWRDDIGGGIGIGGTCGHASAAFEFGDDALVFLAKGIGFGADDFEGGAGEGVAFGDDFGFPVGVEFGDGVEEFAGALVFLRCCDEVAFFL
jgi:hypothetical protein